MTITISKMKLAMAVFAVALLAPATALASHVFDDVPDAAFYADPVEWAADNGITTGKTATTFAPDDGVTRGESVTFLKRYHDNLVAPALDNMGMTSVQEDNLLEFVSITSTSATEIETITIGGSDTVDVGFTAHLQIELDGTTSGRFTISLRAGDCSGEVLGEMSSRSGVTTTAFVQETVPLTAFAESAAPGSTYALCAEKATPGGANGTAYRRGIVATWMPAS